VAAVFLQHVSPTTPGEGAAHSATSTD
jgi:hypothetical protein